MQTNYSCLSSVGGMKHKGKTGLKFKNFEFTFSCFPVVTHYNIAMIRYSILSQIQFSSVQCVVSIETNDC